MSKVFVLGTDKQPLTPVHPAGARSLLKEGKAAVYRRYPFTIILRAKFEKPASTPLRLKIDPGAKTTGLAITNDVTGEVIWAAQLTHRGAAIKSALDKRRFLKNWCASIFRKWPIRKSQESPINEGRFSAMKCVNIF
jgi:hypothetical protein